jgi:glycosyltransferase involved in cell wall biosynthesis
MDIAVLIAFVAVLVPLCLLGVHRLSLLVVRMWMGRVPLGVEVPALAAEPHTVTIQLPLYNERRVARRVIEAAAAIRYPADRLQIQVLDDSTDETVQTCARTCAELQARGVDAVHAHRSVRTGFKAGALAEGLHSASGELIAIFDADFLPRPDFLEVTVPRFDEPDVGMVQARWEHLNRRHSMLTRLQGVLLDGHFLMESAVRHRLGVYFNFNGTAGIWRRRAIDDAGGWSADTLTEDMDLSYRAQLAGWRFVFLEAFTVPAEVPERIRAFRTQQHRWTKGSIQVGGKLLRQVFASPVPLRTKLEAMFHLYSNLAFPFVLLLSLLLPPALVVRQGMPGADSVLWWGVDIPVLGLATLPVAFFYLATEITRREFTPGSLLGVPMAMALGVGMSVNNSRAVIEGLAGHRSEFVRTPKVGDATAAAPRYSSPLTGLGGIELAIAAYYALTIGWCASQGLVSSIPFLCLFLVGFGYVGLLSLLEPRA